MRLLNAPQRELPREDPSVLQPIHNFNSSNPLRTWNPLPSYDLELYDTVYARKDDRSIDKYKQWNTQPAQSRFAHNYWAEEMVMSWGRASS